MKTATERELITSERSLGKLVVFITEACNLRCKYCYVLGSQTDLKRSMVGSMRLEYSVDKFLDNFDSCDYIQFFGGEATLRLDSIQGIINRVRRRFEMGKLSSMPIFGIVTNGLFVKPEETLELLANENVQVTVSLDGPENIQNFLRPTHNGAETYSKIVKNIKALRELGVPVAIETVYTSHHIRMGFTLIDLLNFASSLNASTLYFDPAYPPAPENLIPFHEKYFDTLIKYYMDAIDYWFEKMLANNEIIVGTFFMDILRAIIRGEKAPRSDICPAGVSNLAIDSWGNVYQCSLFYGYPEFLHQNIESMPIMINTSTFPRSYRDMIECQNCAIKHWCRPCAALNVRWGNIWKPDEKECLFKSLIVKRIACWAFQFLIVPENSVTRPLKESVLKLGWLN